ncbi:MAG: hypothetical protein VKM34_11220, partial [Cyanobacteriota bacterium]|nr:hypothetical protein [Cyanobacteriota bacterium]
MTPLLLRWPMVEQPRVLDRNRIGEGPLTRLSAAEMAALEQAQRARPGAAHWQTVALASTIDSFIGRRQPYRSFCGLSCQVLSSVAGPSWAKMKTAPGARHCLRGGNFLRIIPAGMLSRLVGVRNSCYKFDLVGLGCRLKTVAPLLAAPAALLLSQGQAKAVLVYNIFESAGNVVVQTSGSLNLAGATSSSNVNCDANGAIDPPFALICTGPDGILPGFNITGPTSFNGSLSIDPASNVSGLSTILFGTASLFSIDPSYVNSSPIVSSATFNNQTLAGLGFTTTGLIGTWTLTGTS